MSLVKESEYIETPVKQAKVTRKTVSIKAAEQLNSTSLVWILVKRHKVGLLAVGNIVLVLNWAFPAWPELVKSFIY